MFRTGSKKGQVGAGHAAGQATAWNAAGQAATELAVFGAILIFILGTIIRSAVSNGYMQNQNFKAMRMAMLLSWQDSKSNQGMGKPQVTAHNNAQVIFLEDRLSPDYNKYGDMDRSPFIAAGTGTFSYNLLYPITDAQDIVNSLPVQDLWLNGQHFPFTLAWYNGDYAITQPTQSSCYALLSKNTCLANQCFRRYREWAGGLIQEQSFATPAVAPYTPIQGDCLQQPDGASQRTCQENNNACTIFGLLSQVNPTSGAVIDLPKGMVLSGGNCQNATANIDPSINRSSIQNFAASAAWQAFVGTYESTFPNLSAASYSYYFNNILGMLQPVYQYPLFYTVTPNPGSNNAAGSGFSTIAPTCSAHPCANNELSSDVLLKDYYGNATTGEGGSTTNKYGDMQYDLLRMGYYSTAPPPTVTVEPPCATAVVQCKSVAESFPLADPSSTCASCTRDFVAWQWSATAGVSAAMIGLNTSNEQFPTYDVDGRLKQVVIYGISQDSAGTTHVAIEDPAGGDIDQSWDINSCGPKPGLQQSQVQTFTFTQDGTYLLIKEGKLYNPETIGPGGGQVVRSANKRDNIDLIQRSIQLSNNTGRFCTTNPGGAYAGTITDWTQTTYPCTQGGDCANPNPVEVCVNENPCNCFMGGSAGSPTYAQCGKTSALNSGMTVAQTCYDTLQNIIYVRSRLQDLNGRSWITNATGELKVQQ